MESNLPVPQTTSRVSVRAIVSLVTGILSYVVLFFHSLVDMSLLWAIILAPISAIVAVVTGHKARRQIRDSAGVLTGDRLAGAGLALGWIYLGLAILLTILALILFGGIVAGITRLLGSAGVQ